MIRKLKKLWKLWNIIKYFFKDEDNLFLHLLELKAYESLEDCVALEVSMTEEIEDLIFHIRTYYDIPKCIAAISYPDLDGEDIPKIMKKYKSGKLKMEDVLKYADFIGEVEIQRAVERDIIFEHAKTLTFGFKL